MATFAQMMGIMDQGTSKLGSAFGEAKDRTRQAMLDEENKKVREQQMGLTSLQMEKEKYGFDQLKKTETSAESLAQEALATIDEKIAAFSQSAAPEDKKYIDQLKQIKPLLRSGLIKDPEKIQALMSYDPTEMKKQDTNKETQTSLGFDKTRADIGETKARTRALGAPKESTEDKWQTMQSGEDLVQVNPKTGEVRKLGIPGKGTPPTQAKAQAADALDTQIGLIDQMIGKGVKGQKGYTPAHSGFNTAVGSKIGSPSYGMGFKEKPLEGTSAADFEGLLGQVKGGAFLQAIPQMKGSGQLSDAEGKKLEAASTRLSGSLSEDEFIKAAREYQETLKQIKKRNASAPMDKSKDLESLWNSNSTAPTAGKMKFK